MKASTRGYQLKSDDPRNKRHLGVFHFLRASLWNREETFLGFRLGLVVQLDMDRLYPCVRPCVALQIPCFHPLWHGMTITVQYLPRRAMLRAIP